MYFPLLPDPPVYLAREPNEVYAVPRYSRRPSISGILLGLTHI